MFVEFTKLFSLEEVPFYIHFTDLEYETSEKNECWPSPLHIHDEIEFLYVTKGTLSCKTFDNQKILLHEGDIAVYSENVAHETNHLRDTYYYTLRFPLKYFLGKLYPFIELYSFIYTTKNYEYFQISRQKEIAELAKLIVEINEEQMNTKPGMRETIFGKICLIIGLLKNLDFIFMPNSLNDKSLKIIAAVLSFILENLGEKITPKEIAASVNLNPDYLGRLFKHVTGKTLMEYVNFIRLDKAKNLLISTQKSVTEIAMELGFSSTSYFVRSFKKYYWYTPSIYRNTKHSNLSEVILETKCPI